VRYLGRHSVRHYPQFCTAKLQLYSGSIFWEEPRYHGTIQNYGGHEQNNPAPNSADPGWEIIELGKPISLMLQMVHNDQSRNAFLPMLRLLSAKQDIEARTYVRVPGLNPQCRKALPSLTALARIFSYRTSSSAHCLQVESGNGLSKYWLEGLSPL